MSEPFEDGDTVAFGAITCSWSIRQWAQADAGEGRIQYRYDWIADSVNGNYAESDELFDSIEEAKRSLGVD